MYAPRIPPLRGDVPVTGTFDQRVGVTAIMGASLIGVVGCAYGITIGLVTGQLSFWEWVTVPAMGVVCAITAVFIRVTGDRYLERISGGFTAWIVFYLLSNLANALHVEANLFVAYSYAPWFLVLYALMAALFPSRGGIRLAWAVYGGVLLVTLPAGYRQTGFVPGDPASDSLIVNLIAQPALIALLYAVSAFRERYAAAETRAATLAENAAELEFLAYHDTLTKLPNRALVGDRLVHALAVARRSGEFLAVHAVDLDHFKDINDSLGHAAGDAVLVEVSRRLLGLVRESDTVGRMSGDEFVVIQPGLRNPEDAIPAGARIRDILAIPLVVEGRQVVPSGSVGTTLWSPAERSDATDGREEGSDAAAEQAAILLREADAALYAAKTAGRNEHRLFERHLLEEARARLALRTALPRALANGEFELHYQPQFDLATGALVGAEALLRWNDPETGRRPPDEFIPVAEASGMIVPIGDWVIREACRAAAAWPSDVKIEVNVSPVQIERGDLVASVRRALAESGVDPARLELELTESVFADADDSRYRDVFGALTALGVRIVVDDFGTGYSSLLYLRNFPISMLKIDRAFVDRIEEEGTDYAIVKAIVTFARSMGMEVIAEGIERDSQVALLLAEGCRLGQGYLLCRPLPLPELVDRYRLVPAA